MDSEAPAVEKKECLRCHMTTAVKYDGETESDRANGWMLWYCPECDTIQNREGLDAAE